MALVAALAADAIGVAQDSPQVAPAPPPPVAVESVTAANPPTSNPEPAPTPSSLNAVDQTFLRKAAEMHATGVELAKVAEKNAGTEEVQALAQELLGEHSRSIAALREIARATNCELAANPTAPQQATVSEFAGKIGQAFDDGYRAEALSKHAEAIVFFANAAKTAKDAGVRSFAERSLGDMKERHASMGGDPVKLKGEMALQLPKTEKTTGKTVAKNAGPAKGKAKTAPPVTVGATTPLATAPQTVPGGPRFAHRVVTPAARDTRLEPILGVAIESDNRPRVVTETGLEDARSRWRVPAEIAEAAPARKPARPRSPADASRAEQVPVRVTVDEADATIPAAPVARVITRSPRAANSASFAVPVEADRPVVERRVIIRKAPRIFFDEDDDD